MKKKFIYLVMVIILVSGICGAYIISSNHTAIDNTQSSKNVSINTPKKTNTDLQNEPISKPEEYETMYTTDTVNLRSNASTDADIVDTISPRTEVQVVKNYDNQEWKKVKYNNTDGFIYSKYLSLELVEDTPKRSAELSQSVEVDSPISEIDRISQLAAAQRTSQLTVVKANGSRAEISLYNNDGNGWYQVFTTPGYVGKKGVGKTSEGEAITPCGEFRFTQAFGNYGDPGCPLGYTQVDSSYYYVDDSNSAYYNKLVSTNEVGADWASAEHISDIGVYGYVLNTNYNSECIPGEGSAIFFHSSSGSPTAGCVSIPESYMTQLMTSVRSDCIIIIDNGNNVYNY